MGSQRVSDPEHTASAEPEGADAHTPEGVGPAGSAAVVAEMRTTRQRRRLGDTQWGELAYRVYTTGFFVFVVVIMVSGAIGDRPASQSAIERAGESDALTLTS